MIIEFGRKKARPGNTKPNNKIVRTGRGATLTQIVVDMSIYLAARWRFLDIWLLLARRFAHDSLGWLGWAFGSGIGPPVFRHRALKHRPLAPTSRGRI